MTDVDRFLARINKTATCWLWTGSAYRYGLSRINRKAIGAHRAAWIHFRGPIPAGLDVCHRCDVPRCVNPDHLFLGTRKDNMQDAKCKGRIHHGPGADISGDKNPSRRFPDRVRRGDNHPSREKIGTIWHWTQLQPERLVGEGNANAKLTALDVIAIKLKADAGISRAALSAEYKVAAAHISQIVRGKSWKHINTAGYEVRCDRGQGGVNTYRLVERRASGGVQMPLGVG